MTIYDSVGKRYIRLDNGNLMDTEQNYQISVRSVVKEADCFNINDGEFKIPFSECEGLEPQKPSGRKKPGKKKRRRITVPTPYHES